MPLSPQRPRRARPAGNPNLANGCQNFPPSTPAANPSGAPRTTLNKPEQIRTNLNTAERPDQIGNPRITPKKNKPRTPSPPTLRHSCAGRNDGGCRNGERVQVAGRARRG